MKQGVLYFFGLIAVAGGVGIQTDNLAWSLVILGTGVMLPTIMSYLDKDKRIISLKNDLHKVEAERDRARDELNAVNKSQRASKGEPEELQKRIELMEGDLRIAKANWDAACNDLNDAEKRIMELESLLMSYRQEVPAGDVSPT